MNHKGRAAMSRGLKYGLGLLLVLAIWLTPGMVGSVCKACPFCTMQGQTLTGEITQATLVLYGKLSKADEQKETTDIDIEVVIKDNPARGSAKKLTLKRYIDL